MKTNLANLATFLRILLIPLLIGFFLQEKFHIAISLFTLAAMTDGLDGYLARYLHQTSSLGAWLDPVADKLLVISMLILLLADTTLHNLTIPITIIICREVIVSALREWMTLLGQSYATQVSILGKGKTLTQMLSIFLFLASKLYPESKMLLHIAYWIFYLAALFTVISLIHYVWKAWQVISHNTQEK